MNRCSETWWTHYDGMIASHEETDHAMARGVDRVVAS